ncbi:hypothetical protein GCM10029976_029070 [Kribbella albertanoniae]|uniref:ABC transporter permease n=1 Tax=Kribbella albertanoniae TaxID=1266829 RepID=A0A4R4P4J5_9ACTN|nr:ABC transporter permease [Kribbella albertanoniae]TDC14962.1 ABC transporter permease [Kribbella albertanoniae]
MRLGNVVLSELDKLRTLPITVLTMAGTITVAAVIGAAQRRAAAPVDVVPYVQAGFLLLGILPVGNEYTGRQFRTSLIAVPARGLLAVGKTAAAVVALMLTAVAAAAVQYALDTEAEGIGRYVGMTAYLMVIGLLAYAIALLVRHLVPALVGALCLVLILSPLLAGLTEHARWLPDRAAAELYQPTDAALTGPLVAAAWIAVIGAVAIRRFHRSDG